MKDKRRISLYLENDGQDALNAIKQHYNMQSNALAIRRAILEHAKQIAEPDRQLASRITLSRRVY